MAKLTIALVSLLHLVLSVSSVWNDTHLQDSAPTNHVVEPGDTWVALSLRYGIEKDALQSAAGMMNRWTEPAIGSVLAITPEATETTGRVIRTGYGGMLQTATLSAASPWAIVLDNKLASPYRPSFYRPLFITDQTNTPRDLPVGIQTLEVLRTVAQPGEALMFRATLQPSFVTNDTTIPLAATLNRRTISVFGAGERLVGLGATGAFFGNGRPELRIQVANEPPWAQPWLFQDRTWYTEDLYLSGAAAAIDQDAIAAERQRLNEIWLRASPNAQWDAPFRLPVSAAFPISGDYGSRRSYNGGPYETYHEGVDFSAYGGTPVVATAAGTVVLAENLFVRGGSVIIDHGLGIYSGYYHLSSISAAAGQVVSPGNELGKVGTTGLSTGNHLHWDLLVNGMNVDAARWLEYDSACWILEGLGLPCEGSGS